MSTLESIIWSVLGYISMPIIFIMGFAITAIVACYIIEASGHGDKNEE
ncbi:MAG: TIGR02808 family protein [Bermanella sp.]